MFAPVMGNHDSNNQFVWHYNLPNEQDVSKYVTGELPSASSIPADKGNYFYSYNNALFIVLNDAPYPESVDEAKHYIDAYEQTIQAAKAAYPEANWTFVQHHKSTASVAKHCADDDIEYYVNAGLENLFEKQDIDFVLAGHDHVYARSFVMENGKRISDIATDVVNPKGTLYMTANTATGIKYYDIFTLYQQDNEDYPKLANGKAGSKEYLKATSLPLSAHTADQSKLPGYTMIDVQSDSVTFQTYNTYDNPDTPTDESKQVFDKYTVKREPMGNKIGALNNDKAGLKAELTGRYTSGLNDKDGGVCEIVAYNPDNDKIYAVNGKSGALLITDKKDGENGKIADLKAVHIPVDKIIEGNVEGFEYGDMTSVAVITSTKEIAIAVQEKAYNKNGKILFLDYDGNYKSVVDAGVQPDMIKYDEETNTVLTANEGEPREGTGGEDPAGSVTIYDVANKTVKTVGFEKFDDKRDELVKKGVVLMKKTVPSKDLEPEYIATAGGYAYVSLQEANSIAKLNIAKGEFESIMPVGFTDYSKTKIDIDKSDKTYAPKTYETLMGIRMPDGIAAYEQGGKTYVLTANEGDSRSDWPGLDNEKKGKKSPSGKIKTKNKVTYFDASLYDGLDDNKDYLFGGRSFSIFVVKDGELEEVFDSGADFESKTFEFVPNGYNVSNDNIEIEDRSGKKGCEPETVEIGALGDKVYAFIALERTSGIMVYDISSPDKSKFDNYINSRDYSEEIRGDVSPEGLVFIPMANKYGAYLAAANEVSGTVSLYALWITNEAPLLEVKDAVIEEGEEIDLKSLIVKAEDAEDGPNLNDRVIIDQGNFDNKKAGTYEIIYTLTDEGGAKTVKKAIVTVNPGSAILNSVPKLEVKDAVIEEGEEIDLKSLIVKAEDAEDGQNLNDKVVIDQGNFDNKKVGTYEITYTLTDEGGAKIVKKATVTVKAKSANPKSNDNKNGKSSKSDKSKHKSTPETGDNMDMTLYAALLGISGVSLAAMLVKKRKKGN
jgi:hypothetical protein